MQNVGRRCKPSKSITQEVFIATELTDAIQHSIYLIESELQNGEVKIYELVQRVASKLEFAWSDEPLVALYQKQFITQAALCELYFYFSSESWGKELESSSNIYRCRELRITPVSVQLVNTTVNNSSASYHSQSDLVSQKQVQDSSVYRPNFEFYMDHQNFYSATTASVQALLEGFWQKYEAHMNLEPALDVLGLNSNASWSEIQQQYRSLIAIAHPDKGGTPDAFIKIRQAFESLKHSGKYKDV